MRIFIFGLTITSSWGNGHATIWRGLCRSLIKRGHSIKFFEHNVSYYADQRDLIFIEGMDIVLYNSLDELTKSSELSFENCDIAVVTSYCPYGKEFSELIWKQSGILKIFYDLDTPVTINNIRNGDTPSYIHPEGLSNFDLVLSYTAGNSISDLKTLLGAKKVFPLFGSADPNYHFRVEPSKDYICKLSYLGTYSEDRQYLVENLFIKTALEKRGSKFLIGGSSYPPDIKWPENVTIINHVPPPEHPSFYSSSEYTLNITREAMAESGYCPSGRLFEAALCGTPIISDYWKGIEYFLIPGKEIIIAECSKDVINAFEISETKRREMSKAARNRVLNFHTSDIRAGEFEKIISSVLSVKERSL